MDVAAVSKAASEQAKKSASTEPPKENFFLPYRQWDEDIVISGISGRYPESDNVDEFWNNLLSGEELVSIDDRRWPQGYLNTPPRQGKIKSINKLDYEFFRMKQEDANCMDPQIRLLHETCYEAIVDAGIDPNEMRGSRTGVFIGHCYDDTDSAHREDASKAPAFKQISASRVSYAFDLRGPVSSTDTACASSFTAFYKAVAAMRSGDADAMLVCGCAIHLRPFTAVAFHNLKMLSDDGRSKCMDADADGYCRSEAVVSVLLQKKSQAKRIYSTILNTRTNTDGFKPEGITFPSYSAQRRLMVETYSEAGVDPRSVEYMEAHMTGTPAGDPVESAAIVDVLCPEDRTTGPLLVGCLKSNMGHTEGASGTCGITKACLVFQRRELPPNLHLKTPNPNIEGLKTGQLKPVLERMPFNGSVIGVNSFGFGGCNVHAVLQANDKSQTDLDFDVHGPSLPYRMVHLCARNKDLAEEMFQQLVTEKAKLTRGYLALLEDYSKTSVSLSGMNTRAACLLDKDFNIVSSQFHTVRESKPLWLVYSALGCQWPAMAKELMPIERFAESINKSIELVKKHSIGVDLHRLLFDETAPMDDLISTFLAIVSVQIALTDVLTQLDVKIEGIVGHSVGEIAAGYADGCMTHEQTILAAYAVSKNAVDHVKSKGKMIAVGLSWSAMEEKLQEMDSKIQSEVFVGCNNAHDTITLSGWAESIDKVSSALVKEEIMVRDIDCVGIPFHCPLVMDTFEPMRKHLSEILPEPKTRSSRWLSTSVPEERWHEEQFRVLGPNYYPNSMISPVRFYEVFQYIPKDAVVVEVGPHAMLLSLLKRGLGPDASCIPLMRKKDAASKIRNSCNLQLFLNAIGAMYTRGHAPAIGKLYPPVEYPVPRETASLSPLIKWNHSKDLTITKFPDYFNVLKGNQVASFDLMEPKAQFLAGHCIDGRILFPATGYLWVIWQRYVMSLGVTNSEECPIEFFNVKFHRATMLPKAGTTSFVIRHMPNNGSFTITEGGSVCVSGFVKVPEAESVDEFLKMIDPPIREDAVTLTTKELYKEFRVRGYDYGPSFQGLVEASSDGTRGKIKWLGNWISFTDSMLQLAILGKKERGLFIPTFIEYMKCDVKKLLEEVKSSKNEMGESVLEAQFDKEISAGCSTGIVIKGLRASPAPRRSVQTATVESFQFVPYIEKSIEKPLNSSEMDKMEKYINYCQRMIRIVQTNNTNGLREAIETDDGLKILLESNDDKIILAKTLWEVIHARDEDKSIVLTDVLRDSMIKSSSQLCDDTLLRSVLTSERLLRSQVDIVMENLPAKKINICEALETAPLCNEIYELIESSGISVASYQVLHPKSEEIRNKYGVDSSPLTSHVNANLEADLFVYLDKSTRFIANEAKYSVPEFTAESYLASAVNSLKSGSFLLIAHRSQVTSVEKNICQTVGYENYEEDLKSPEHFEDLLRAEGLPLISRKSSKSGYHTLLFRKVTTDTVNSDVAVDAEESVKSSPVVVEVKLNDYSWVDEMKSHLVDKEDQVEKTARKKYKVWLVAKDSAYSGIIGLVNCLRRELGSERIRSVFCPPEEQSDKINGDNLTTPEILNRDLVINVFNGGEYGSYRHYQLDTIETWKETEHTYLDVKTKGDLSSLQWIEGDHKHWPSLPETAKDENDLLCHIYYSSLNFKDIMVATGRIPVDAYPADFMGTGLIGMEFSGKDQHGNRILAFAPSKSIATTLLLPAHNFMWRVPDHWTMAEAATVPVCYVTVYYALFVRGNLQPGESILIHAGSGGIGQAAISVCLNIGCNVFTTVGSKAKKDFILQEFPQIPESHIGNSRDCSFEEMILRETDGKGVDMVINSLADDKLQASIRCLADFGRFIEIGKYDIIQNNPLNISDLGRNKTYHVVCVAHLDFDALINKSESALRLCNKLHKVIQNGIDTRAIRPLKYHVFEKDQAEEAFRFMSTGKHMGKVLIKIRDEDDLKALPLPVTINALKQTHFHPLKSYIITGGLGGFGLELADWIIQRGARKLILTSRSGAKAPFQQVSIQRFKRDREATVIVSNSDVSTIEGASTLIDEALSVGPIGGIFHLAMVLKDAAIENQSEESFRESCASKVAGTIHLDQLTRTRCQDDLDYFVCFSSVTAGRGNAGQINYGFSNSVMERICEVRRKNGLPGLAIQWGAIGDVGVVAESIGGNDIIIGGTVPQRMPSCLSILDSFLQAESIATVSSIVKADKRRTTGAGKGDLLRQVCHILGVKDPSSLDPNTTLGDLGLDSLMAVEIRQALERDYELVLTAQEVRSLKIKDIQQIGSTKVVSGDKKTDASSASASAASIAGVTPFRLKPAEQMFIFLSNSQSSGGRPIYMLASAADDFSILETLSTSIIRPVVAINWTSELDKFTSIRDAAQYIVKQLRDSYPDSTYDILGNSFGSAVAFEMALELQSKLGTKAVTKLLLMDGSPVYCKEFHKPYLTFLDIQDADQSHIEALCAYVLYHLHGHDLTELKSQLTGLTLKEERIKVVADYLTRVTKKEVAALDLASASERFFQKLRLINNYTQSEKKFIGEARLLRPTNPGHVGLQLESIDANYGLAQLVDGKQDSRKIDGDSDTYLISHLENAGTMIDEHFQYLTFA